MILYDLKCKAGHVFEVWFKNSSAYDAQSAARELQCPHCGTSDVTKAPMAPHLARHHGEAAPSVPASVPEPAATSTPAPVVIDDHAREILHQIHEAMAQLREHVEKNCDYVGPRFPDEARKIHYGETETRGIYGEASDDEAKALNEEGIEVQRLAWMPKRKAN